MTILEEKAGRNPFGKLRTKLSDILAWMLDGWLLWKCEGLTKPKAVADAAAEYKNEMDIISAFVESEYVEKGG